MAPATVAGLKQALCLVQLVIVGVGKLPGRGRWPAARPNSCAFSSAGSWPGTNHMHNRDSGSFSCWQAASGTCEVPGVDELGYQIAELAPYPLPLRRPWQCLRRAGSRKSGRSGIWQIGKAGTPGLVTTPPPSEPVADHDPDRARLSNVTTRIVAEVILTGIRLRAAEQERETRRWCRRH